jgi:gas vesicle protein
MHKNETNVISIIGAFAIGGLIGAGIALLMAPQSGEETRNMLRNRSYEMRDRAMETAEETRYKAEKAIDDIADRTKKKTEDIKRQSHEALEGRRTNL